MKYIIKNPNLFSEWKTELMTMSSTIYKCEIFLKKGSIAILKQVITS